MGRITASLLTLLVLFAPYTSGFAESFEQSYQEIRPAQPTQATAGKIEVLEVFWYGCPHCYDFEPHLTQWLKSKPEDVQFRRMPAIFRENWIPHAKAYFTAVKMDMVDKIHRPLFDALHKEKRPIYSNDAIKDFVVERGVDGDEFSRIYDSNEIETKVKQALIMGQRYGVTGVPSVIVNGKYLTSGRFTGTFEGLLKVVDQLVDKERQELKGE